MTKWQREATDMVSVRWRQAKTEGVLARVWVAYSDDKVEGNVFLGDHPQNRKHGQREQERTGATKLPPSAGYQGPKKHGLVVERDHPTRGLLKGRVTSWLPSRETHINAAVVSSEKNCCFIRETLMCCSSSEFLERVCLYEKTRLLGPYCCCHCHEILYQPHEAIHAAIQGTVAVNDLFADKIQTWWTRTKQSWELETKKTGAICTRGIVTPKKEEQSTRAVNCEQKRNSHTRHTGNQGQRRTIQPTKSYNATYMLRSRRVEHTKESWVGAL